MKTNVGSTDPWICMCSLLTHFRYLLSHVRDDSMTCLCVIVGGLPKACLAIVLSSPAPRKPISSTKKYSTKICSTQVVGFREHSGGIPCVLCTSVLCSHKKTPAENFLLILSPSRSLNFSYFAAAAAALKLSQFWGGLRVAPSSESHLDPQLVTLQIALPIFPNRTCTHPLL